MTAIVAIDPGTRESGFCRFEDGRVVHSDVLENEVLLSILEGKVEGFPDLRRRQLSDVLAIEMIASYGMAVGKEVFETCVWIGRFQQAWHTPRAVLRVYRGQVKQHLCHTAKAKDANIRQALLDKVGPQGTKKAPGPTYGVRSHAWAALAVAVTATETMLRPVEQVA